jgi:hypothetical protein
VPQEAVDCAKAFFGRLTAQDISAWTGLTLDEAKTARLAPGFTPTLYDFPGAVAVYYFPAVIWNKFLFLVYAYKDKTGSFTAVAADMWANSALNSLESSPTAPISFFTGRDGNYVRDSKGAVTLLEKFLPIDERRAEEQKKAIAKLALPKNVALTGWGFAYPGEAGQLVLIDDGLPELVVKDYKNGWKYVSRDGGKTWQNNAKPPMYVSIPATFFPQKDGQIPFAVHNNTKADQWLGLNYALRKWDGQKWLKMPEIDQLPVEEIAMLVKPGKSGDMTARWKYTGSGADVPAGRYKLVKTLNANGLELICEAVFTLV